MLVRDIEQELLPFCESEGVGASKPEQVQAIEGMEEIKLQEADMVLLEKICTSPS